MKARNILILLMKNRDMNQGQLSAETGISRSIISQIVNGRVVPTDEELEKICVALGTTPEQVYPDDKLREALSA